MGSHENAVIIDMMTKRRLQSSLLHVVNFGPKFTELNISVARKFWSRRRQVVRSVLPSEPVAADVAVGDSDLPTVKLVDTD